MNDRSESQSQVEILFRHLRNALDIFEAMVIGSLNSKAPPRSPELDAKAISVAIASVLAEHTAAKQDIGPFATYSISEARKMIGIGQSRFYAYINSGQLRAIKIGKKTKIHADDLRAFVDGLPTYNKALTPEKTGFQPGNPGRPKGARNKTRPSDGARFWGDLIEESK